MPEDEEGGPPAPQGPGRKNRNTGGNGGARQQRRLDRADVFRAREAAFEQGDRNAAAPWATPTNPSVPQQLGVQCGNCNNQYGHRCRRTPKLCGGCCERLQHQEMRCSPCGDWNIKKTWHCK